MIKKIISIFVLLVCTGVMLFGDSLGALRRRGVQTDEMDEDALILWYTDSDYAEYLRDAAVSYEKKNGVKVIPMEVSDVEYLEQIQKASADGLRSPDLFMLTSDQLEKAVLSGLAAQVRDPDKVLNSAFYTDASMRAVSYRDRMYGYPLSYETAFVIYNETIMEEIAKNVILQGDPENTEGITLVDSDEEDGEAVEERELTEEEELQVDTLAKNILPTSVVGIMDFANSYSLPSGVEQYFLWDTEDVLYNYWFAGAYLNVGGENSDRTEEINIYNDQALYSLKVYQDFKNFFSIGDEEQSYDETIDGFLNRKYVFTVAGTDIISKMEKAKEEGKFTDEYDVLPISMLNSTMNSKGLSVTTMVCINGLGEDRIEAEKFADFMTNEYAPNLYARCEKLTAARLSEYPYPQMKSIEDYYEHTVSLPKMVETTNYYILAEMCFSNIWDGEDVNKELKALAESVMRSVYGNDFSLESIDSPEVSENYNAQSEN